MLHIAVKTDRPNDAAEFGAWTGYRIPEDRSGWHPLVCRLYDYWLTIAPPRQLPGRQHIIPEDLAPLWSRLFMLEVFRGPLRFRYRFCGTELTRSLGREVTGVWLDEIHPALVSDPASRERFRFMVEAGCPTWRFGKPLWGRNPDHHTIETCIVPLAADGVVVDKLLGVAVAYDIAGRPL